MQCARPNCGGAGRPCAPPTQPFPSFRTALHSVRCPSGRCCAPSLANASDPAAISILERLDHMKLEVVHLCLEPLDPALEFLTRANVVTARGDDEILSHQAVDCIRVLGCFQTSFQKFSTMATLFR